VRRFVNRPEYDINLFYENILPGWFPRAQVNCMIPNQEWFRPHQMTFLKNIDMVLCKTRHAQEIFNRLGCHTEYISFTSMDRHLPQVAKDYRQFLHLAGASWTRGTKEVIQAWRAHPEWPRLTILQNPRHDMQLQVDNIDYLAKYLDDGDLAVLQNRLGMHITISSAEGFGHSIVEGMSCQSAVITTDAPPMNEIVTPGRGFLVAYGSTAPMSLGTQYFVDVTSLERQVKTVMDTPVSTLQQVGESARAWYVQNEKYFRGRLLEVIQAL
jgi:glycosyltransferase involved in cell wall biosynthesis